MSSVAPVHLLGDWRAHPATDCYPLPTDAEIAWLAEDIRRHGLRHPVVQAVDGTILDGRARLIACAQVGVVPLFTVYDGDDPAALVRSLNLYRRHLSPGQQGAAQHFCEESTMHPEEPAVHTPPAVTLRVGGGVKLSRRGTVPVAEIRVKDRPDIAAQLMRVQSLATALEQVMNELKPLGALGAPEHGMMVECLRGLAVHTIPTFLKQIKLKGRRPK